MYSAECHLSFLASSNKISLTEMNQFLEMFCISAGPWRASARVRRAEGPKHGGRSWGRESPGCRDRRTRIRRAVEGKQVRRAEGPKHGGRSWGRTQGLCLKCFACTYKLQCRRKYMYRLYIPWPHCKPLSLIVTYVHAWINCFWWKYKSLLLLGKKMNFVNFIGKNTIFCSILWPKSCSQVDKWPSLVRSCNQVDTKPHCWKK